MNSTERHQARYERRKQKREEKRLSRNKQYDNYNILLNPVNLYNSFYLCRKEVSWKYSIQNFHLHLLENISYIIKLLEEGKLPTKGFINFKINERGKVRNIRSPHIMERVLQKTLCNEILLPILSNTLIYDNGASLKGKGTGFTRKRLVHHLSDYYRHYGTDGYILIVDFSKYFDNINHEILMKMVRVYVHDERVLNIIQQAVDEFGGIGLGLGAQISQILAIFFPSIIDHYFKDILSEKYYGRYMDDSYIISNSRDHLLQCGIILQDICSSIGIKLNLRKTKIIKINEGVLFLHCKYHFTKSGKIIKCGGKESAKRTRHKISYFKKELNNDIIPLNYIIDWYKSWRGYMMEFDSKTQLINTDNKFNKLIGEQYGISFHYKNKNCRTLCR